MRKTIIPFLVLIVAVAGFAYAGPAIPADINYAGSIERFSKGDRILILAPHPDDETIGCAGVIQQALSAGARLQVVYLTNGDHNQVSFIVYEKRLTIRKGEFIHMGEVRRQEAIKAMRLLGLSESNLIFLGYPDFGTFNILSQYWGDTKSFRSFLTRISSVPYRENLSFGAPYKGESILNDLKKVLLAFRPNKIFISHPADTNVDHKSLYLFLQVALRDLGKDIPAPKVYPYLIHCVGWPRPRHYHPELSLDPPQKFLHSSIPWIRVELNQQQLNKKHQAVLCYGSQTRSSAFYLLAFCRKNELFGDYSDIILHNQAMPEQGQVSFSDFSALFIDSHSAAQDKEESSEYAETKNQIGYALSQGDLFITISKKQELKSLFGIVVYLFGYRKDQPFSAMPKIRIFTRAHRFKVFNGRKVIQAKGVSTELNSGQFIIRVPLQLLGEPEFILASVKTAGVLPFETSGFRKIRVDENRL